MGFLACIATCMYVSWACMLFAGGMKTPHVCPPCTCGTDISYKGVMVNCMGLRLKSLPVQLPVNTTTLLLSNNEVTNLTEQMFQRFPHLRALDLSHNSIVTIHENGFKGISKLKKLNLQFNQLVLDSQTYHPNVFKDLTELEELRIVDNDNITDHPHATYPDQSFQHLTSLKVLYLDGLPTDFGPGFGQLRNLRNLTLSGYMKYCYLPVLQNTTFTNVPTVQHLNISNCCIRNTDLLAFQPMKLIKSIDMSDNDNLGFTNLTNATYGLQHSSLEKLKINRIYRVYDVCTHLEANHIKHLANTTLKELYMDGNGIIVVQSDAVSSLPKSIETLSARANKFQYGQYMMLGNELENLKVLDVSEINKMKPMPFFKRSAKLVPYFLSACISVPPKLEILIASECYFRGEITPGGLMPNNIKQVIVDNNFFTALHGPIAGLEKVEFYDFSNNILEDIGMNYFSENNSVSKLNLTNNILGGALAKDTKGYMFLRLTKARIIDLSMNRIAFLPRHIFTGLRSVEVINLNDNYLQSFEVDLPITLKQLHLSGNKIQMLSPDILRNFDNLPKLKLYLQFNPISCTCQGVGFLKWLSDNKHRIHGLEHMTCELEPGHEIPLSNFDAIIQTLSNRCNLGNVIAVATSLSLFIFILGTIGVTIGYRHRWKIRYLYYVSRSKYRVQHAVDDDGRGTFQYDVFVSYASKDRVFVTGSLLPELETNRELRVWIHDRDSTPGDQIADTIVDVIRRSQKTLIVLSPSFLDSHWGEFVFNMARIEWNDRHRNTLVVVMYKYAPIRCLWKDISVMIRNNNYLEYPEDPAGKDVFWGNVAEAIRS
ncbi:toll-like receptor 4 [Haliotis cracherodii]|uniref:toll-like receptor 4 n=1 Tax=Haliotis cracherodii TaxID=6455 RepID=UPI0039EA35FE